MNKIDLSQHWVIAIFAFCLSIFSCDSANNSEIGFDHEPGPILFITNESGTDQLYSIQPDGTELKQLTSDQDEPVIDAVWSPDGYSIVLTSWVGEDAGAYFKYLYLVDAEGTNRRRLSKDNSDLSYESDSRPVWSPDGKRIVFQKIIGCCEGGFPEEVFVVRSDGTGMQKIGGRINSRRTFITDWSDDGLSLLGHTSGKLPHGPTDQLYNYVSDWSLSGDSLFAFGGVGKHYSWPVLSSSGQYIAFQINDNSQTGVYRATRTGTDLIQIAGSEYIGIKPVQWSPDDSKILATGGVKRAGLQHLERMLLVDAAGNDIVDISPFFESSCRPTSWKDY